MNYSNHRLAGVAIMFTEETEQEVLDFWKGEGVDTISQDYLNKRIKYRIIGVRWTGIFGYWVGFEPYDWKQIFPSVSSCREWTAKEFGSKRQVVELDENGELDVTGWEATTDGTYWAPLNVTKRIRPINPARSRLSELKAKRAELDREIKELESKLK